MHLKANKISYPTCIIDDYTTCTFNRNIRNTIVEFVFVWDSSGEFRRVHWPFRLEMF